MIELQKDKTSRHLHCMTVCVCQGQRDKKDQLRLTHMFCISLPRFSAQTGKFSSDPKPRAPNRDLPLLLLFRSSHLHPENIHSVESAMFFSQFLVLSDPFSNCTAWSALILGMKAILLKVKPWNLFAHMITLSDR